MKELLYKKFNVLEIILLLSPIIDMLTAVSQRFFNVDISLGLIARSFFLFFMVMYLVVKSKYKYKKITIIYLLSYALYSILFIINTYITKGQIYILAEIKELIKAFYFPICIISIVNYLETNEYKMNLKILFIVIMEYIILLFIPSILNIGYDSYAEDKIGTIGWFFSSNEISAIYSILIVFVIFSYRYIKNTALYFVIVTLSLYTILQIGTKMPALTSAIVIIGYIVIQFLQYIKSKEKVYLNSMNIGILVAVLFVVLFIYSPVMKNFDIYKKYLITTRDEVKLVDSNSIEEGNTETNDLDNMKELSQENHKNENNVEENIVNENNTDKNLTNETLTGEEIATIIHSGRAETRDKIEKIFDNSSIINKTIGIGKINSEQRTYYLTEIDYFDILYNYGYLGFIIYFIPIISSICFIIIKSFSKDINLIISNDNKCIYIIMIINGFLCAIAGHTFVAPAVSIYISIAIIQLYKEMEKN